LRRQQNSTQDFAGLRLDVPTIQQQARLARLEAATAHAGHCAVVLYRDRDDVPHLLADAVQAGRVVAGFGLLVLPMPRGLDEWIDAAEAHRLAFPGA
jgi:hypothetical protein